MQPSRNEYDRGVNTFSPEGRLFQVEYALEAVKLGSTTVGVRCNDGVVLCTEKRIQNVLVDERVGDLVKIVEIDRHVGACSAGVIADARLLVDHCRVESANHHFTYDEAMPIRSIVDSASDLLLDFSGVNDKKKKSMSRPFGTALLLAGIDPKHGPELWCVDPSGSSSQYKACAIGSAHDGAESLLQEKYKNDLTFEEAEVLALSTLRQGMEEKISAVNVEVCCIRTGGTYTPYTVDNIKELIERLPLPGAAERVLDEAVADK